jgi:hypothetical protein
MTLRREPAQLDAGGNTSGRPVAARALDLGTALMPTLDRKGPVEKEAGPGCSRPSGAANPGSPSAREPAAAAGPGNGVGPEDAPAEG